jgi:hypothetical protein
VHFLSILDYGWRCDLASEVDGENGETMSTALGCILLPGFSAGPDGARTCRTKSSMSEFYAWLGEKKGRRIRLAVMDMWKPFRLARGLGCGSQERIWTACGPRYFLELEDTLLSRRENLTLDGRKALKTLLSANKRLNTAYVLKESFGQLWSYEREGLGAALLRELAGKPQVAAAQAL